MARPPTSSTNNNSTGHATLAATNGATLDAGTGVLYLKGADAYAGTLALNGSIVLSNGSHTFADGTTINGTGTLIEDGGAVTMNDVTLNKTYALTPGDTLTINPGKTLTVDGQLFLQTTTGQRAVIGGGGTLAIANTATATFTSADDWELQFDNVTIANAGTFNVQGAANLGTIDLNNGAAFHNLATGHLNFVNAGNTITQLSGTGTVSNAGTLTNGPTGSRINVPTLNLDAGTVTLAPGTTLTKNGGTANWNGGTIAGTGSLTMGSGASFVIAGGGNRVLNGTSLSVASLNLTSGSLVPPLVTFSVAGATRVTSPSCTVPPVWAVT